MICNVYKKNIKIKSDRMKVIKWDMINYFTIN